MSVLDFICWAYVVVSAAVYLSVLCSLDSVTIKFKLIMMIHAILFAMIAGSLLAADYLEKNPATPATKSHKVMV